MKLFFFFSVILPVCAFFAACNGGEAKTAVPESPTPSVAEQVATPAPTVEAPKIPNLQAELIEAKDKSTTSPLGSFDFKNYKYKLPRGWQDADGGEAELVGGKREFTMTEEERRTGLSFVTTKYMDLTGDGQDEAVVILKIETGGSAIPQIVYIYEWKNEQPALIWFFRTGDRADGGLKSIRAENGGVAVELYGQDRYIIGELDTLKITGDEEQICCPTFFTRTQYKWNGNQFRQDGKRLTFSMTDKTAPPIENMGDLLSEKEKKK